MPAKQKSDKKAKNNHHILARVIFLVVLAVIFGISFIWTDQINRALGLTTVESGEYDGAST